MLVTSSAHISGSATSCAKKETREIRGQKLLPPPGSNRRPSSLRFPTEMVQATQRAVEAGGGTSG